MTLSGLNANAQNTLWAVFAIQGIAAVVYGLSGFRLPAEKRDHFSAFALTLAVAVPVSVGGMLHALAAVRNETVWNFAGKLSLWEL